MYKTNINLREDDSIVIHGLINIKKDIAQQNKHKAAQYKSELKPIITDFQKKGWQIEDLYKLQSIPEFVRDENVLLSCVDWLAHVKNKKIRDELLDIIYQNKHIARYLDEIIPMAIEQWKNTLPNDHNIRTSAGNIIWRHAREKDYEQIMSFLKFVEKRDYGETSETNERWYFIEALGRMKKHPVADILIKYLANEHVLFSAIRALGNLKDPKALPHLKPFLNHKSPDITKYTVSAIAKIEKAQEKKKL